MTNKCPNCNGAGQYSLPEAAWRPGDDGWYKCERCKGSGKMTDKIKVRFETTKERLLHLLIPSGLCPGDLVPGEITSNVSSPCYGDNLVDCDKCYKAFIDRISEE